MAKRESIRFRGKVYPTMASLAAAFCMPATRLYGRLENSWSLEEALEVVKRKRQPPPGKPVEYQGKTYPSTTALAKAFGQSPNNVAARLRREWSVAQAVGDEEPPLSPLMGRRKRTSVKTKHGVKVFNTFKEACEWCGVDRTVAYGRLGIGWTIEEALEQVDKPEMAYAGYGVIYRITNTANGMAYVGQTMRRLARRWKGHRQAARKDGRTYLARAMREFGLKKFAVEPLEYARNRADLNRLEEKWIKKLGTLWPAGYNRAKGGSGNVKGKVIRYKGKTYLSLSHLASAFGLDSEVVRRRLVAGYDLETAVEHTEHLFRKPCVVEGVRYSSEKVAAEHYGLSHKKVHRRRKRGWTLRQALGLDSRKKSKTAPKGILVQGTTYESRRAAADHYRLEYRTVLARLNKGWSVEEAFELTKRREKTDHYNAQEVIVRGVTYHSMSAAARALNVPFHRVQMRLKIGWSVDDAYTKPHRDAGKT
jgi:group I intron endonuclease